MISVGLTSLVEQAFHVLEAHVPRSSLLAIHESHPKDCPAVSAWQHDFRV
jgi:hypothetical protein